jgi:hypothetical protein
MSDYVQDPNDSKKQVPGQLPDNAYDRVSSPIPCSSSMKTPNSVYIVSDLTNTVGFFFGSSASFASAGAGKEAAGGNGVSASAKYTIFGGEASLNAGTQLNIHPLAWSGSLADKGKVMFVYKSGLSTGGF